jgi:transposase
MAKRQRRTYTDEFKAQMVKLYESGKSKNEIISEYDLTPSAFNTWIKRSATTSSFKEKDSMLHSAWLKTKERRKSIICGWSPRMQKNLRKAGTKGDKNGK